MIHESDFDVKTFLKNLPSKPGVYQMFANDDTVLYVGKAQNLKKRVKSYFQQKNLSVKTIRLMAQVHHIEVTTTASETEALLLEFNLIKKHKPRYNVLLRDDKSYPYLAVNLKSDFPRIDIYRGPQRKGVRYYGPFPSAGSARVTLQLIQKIFKLRQCSDAFFRNRSRPCLQYQIGRCTAPCVGYIDKDRYAEDLQHALQLLEGENQTIIDDLLAKMDAASNERAYELAASYRDQIAHLRKVQTEQCIAKTTGDIDVIGMAVLGHISCVHVLSIRGGMIMGSKAFYPSQHGEDEPETILTAFLCQYYLNPVRKQSLPREIIIPYDLNDSEWIARTLEEEQGRRVDIRNRVRKERATWLKMANSNAEQTLDMHMAQRVNFHQRLEALQKAFKLPSVPERMECFDVSHTLGEATVASCVVFDSNGPLKQDYRRYNIEGITPGDDYAALEQVLLRRYKKVKEHDGVLPDIIFIDGGKGQMGVAERALETCQVSGFLLVGVAKGPDRKAGLETLFYGTPLRAHHLPPTSEALHLIQHIRDEAHRFAIVAHRAKRGKARGQSPLETIDGVGRVRRQALLRHFGGLREIKAASAKDLAKVPGISVSLARKILAHLRDGD